MAAHRYWRLYFTSAVANYAQIVEVELRTSTGGADVTGTGTATADSIYSGSYDAAKAFDNSSLTSWCSTNTNFPHWLAYDFGIGNDKDIVQYAITSLSPETDAPYSWYFQCSDDGSAWTTIGYVDNQTWTALETKTFNATSFVPPAYRYWRWLFTESTTDTSIYLSELTAHIANNGPSIIASGTVTADSVYGAGYEASSAIDANATTYWASTNTALPHWLACDFGASNAQSLVKYTLRSTASTTYAPKSWSVQRSDNGTDWVTHTAQAGQTWTSYETKSFPIEYGSTISGAIEDSVVSTCLYTNDTIDSIIAAMEDSVFAAEDCNVLQKIIGVILDRAGIVEYGGTKIVVQSATTDSLHLSEALPVILRSLVADGVTLTDQSPGSLRKIAELAEILSAADGAVSTLKVAAMLMDLLAAHEAMAYVRVASLADTITAADQLSAAIRQITQSVDFVEMTESLRCRMTALISDQVSAEDLIHPQLHVLMGYSDTLLLIDGLVLDDGEPYTAWVMNAESTGMSRWTLPQLNSLFDHGGDVFGVSKTGLWELGGETDNGTEINAWVKTGHLDFGTSRLKNIPRGYLRVQSNGAMQLVTSSSDRGVRTQRAYEISATFSGDDAALRTEPLARGLRGVYWQFQIGNVAGTDFNLDDTQVLPVILSRRGR
jgi:hypothetical protein